MPREKHPLKRITGAAAQIDSSMPVIYRLVTVFSILATQLITEGSAFSMTNSHPPEGASTSTQLDPAAAPSSDASGDMRFGRFLIPKASIFARTSLSAAFVNLRPIVPGHVLIMPQRITPLMEDLTTEEYTDMWLLVRRVQAMLKDHYESTAFNVAVQDGRAAGQSVPHVHVHILPRKAGDLERNDDVYEALEEWAPRIDMAKERTSIEVPEDADRVDRTVEMMADEAALYRSLIGEDATSNHQ
jgi:bis(5'-adenosyl)-triphosphatase